MTLDLDKTFGGCMYILERDVLELRNQIARSSAGVEGIKHYRAANVLHTNVAVSNVLNETTTANIGLDSNTSLRTVGHVPRDRYVIEQNVADASLSEAADRRAMSIAEVVVGHTDVACPGTVATAN